MKKLLHIFIYIGLALCSISMAAATDSKPFVVVIDAGHGGKDPGTMGTLKSHREKDIALNISLAIGRMLNSEHPEIKVIYTRSTDVFVELGRRAEIANKAKADLFVSIHVNSLPKGSRYAYGVQSYTLSLSTAGTNLEVEKRENSVIALEGDAAKKYNYDMSAESNIMFELMQDHDMKQSVEFAKLAQYEMVNTAKRRDMGVRQANLAVLRLTYMPSVLLEVGFMSTPSEEQFLMSSSGQKTMANSIYNAIVRYSAKQQGRNATSLATPSTAESNYDEADEAAADAKNNSEQSEKASAQTAAKASAQSEKASAQTTVKTTAKTTAKTSASLSRKTTKTVYKVQILAGSVRLKSNDRQFKGLKCEMHQNKGRYTYTYGSANTLAEAKKIRASILDKFPEAFIVTFTE